MTKEKTAHLEEKLKDELLYREDCIDKISRYKKAIKTMKEVNPYNDSIADMNVDNMISVYKVNLSNWKSRLALTNERIHNLRMAITYRNW